MNKKELLEKLYAVKVDSLHSVSAHAARLIADADILEIEVDLGENNLPVEHYFKIYHRRIAHARSIGLKIEGLEETVASMAARSGNLRVGYADMQGLGVSFFLDDTGDIVGCFIAQASDEWVKEKWGERKLRSSLYRVGKKSTGSGGTVRGFARSLIMSAK